MTERTVEITLEQLQRIAMIATALVAEWSNTPGMRELLPGIKDEVKQFLDIVNSISSPVEQSNVTPLTTFSPVQPYVIHLEYGNTRASDMLQPERTQAAIHKKQPPLRKKFKHKRI